MPGYIFTGPYESVFPESRHSDGSNVGTVEPGEVRDMDAAPDHQWRLATDEDRAARAAELMRRAKAAADAEAEAAGEQAADSGQQAPPVPGAAVKAARRNPGDTPPPPDSSAADAA
jgi:hypothetical protein